MGFRNMYNRKDSYTRADIKKEFGGPSEDSLINVNGKIVAVCMLKDLNPDAPTHFINRDGKRRWSNGDVLCAQAEPFPVYVKWFSGSGYDYKGFFKFKGIVTDQDDIEHHTRRLEGIAGSKFRVIELEPVPTPSGVVELIREEIPDVDEDDDDY